MLCHEFGDARLIISVHRAVQDDEAIRMSALDCREGLIEIVRAGHPDRLKDHTEQRQCLLDIVELEYHSRHARVP